MSRAIDADALIRDIEHYHVSDGKFQHWVEVQPTIEERKVEELLPDGTLHLFTDTDLSKVNRVWVSQNGTHYGDLYYADGERKTGKWIYHSDWETDGECGYECSECGMGSDVDYNYCMNCGAKMDGGQTNE